MDEATVETLLAIATINGHGDFKTDGNIEGTACDHCGYYMFETSEACIWVMVKYQCGTNIGDTTPWTEQELRSLIKGTYEIRQYRAIVR